MADELLSNANSAEVTTGGTTAPAAGTVEAWVVTTAAAFPVLVAGQQFRVIDQADLGKTSGYEIMLVTASANGAGVAWTATRGVEGTTPYAHAANWTCVPVPTAAGLLAFVEANAAPVASSIFHLGLNGNGAAYINPLCRNHASVAQTLGQLNLHVFNSGPAGVTVSEFGIYIATSGGAGAVYRLGLYTIDNQADPFDWTPGNAWASLLLDAGTIPTTGSYGQSLTLVTPQAIPPNTWFAVGGVSQVAVCSVEAAQISYGAASPFGMSAGGGSYGLPATLSLYQAGVSAGLPATFTPGGANSSDSGVGIYRSA